LVHTPPEAEGAKVFIVTLLPDQTVPGLCRRR